MERCPECRAPLGNSLGMCGQPDCAVYGIRPACAESYGDDGADRAYRDRMARLELRHTGADDGAHHRDPLLSAARQGDARAALLYLQQMGVAGIGHEPGEP
jgi:hypothetical protein